VKVTNIPVFSVTESELKPQNVSVHSDTSLMKTVFVNNVVQNVNNVKDLPITVLNVLMKDNQVLKMLPQSNVHVSKDSSKRMTPVTNVLINVSIVKETKILVSIVTVLPEDQLMLVHVLLVISKLTQETLSVLNVVTFVLNVLLGIIVLFVQVRDNSIVNHLVHVQLV
jgi:hypothetical protein